MCEPANVFPHVGVGPGKKANKESVMMVSEEGDGELTVMTGVAIRSRGEANELCGRRHPVRIASSSRPLDSNELFV